MMPSTDRAPTNKATNEDLTRILAIISKETGIALPTLSLDATIEDLGIPSLDMVQIVFEIESQFDIEVPILLSGADVEFQTLQDLVDHVMVTIARAQYEPAGRLSSAA
jgi:acyl carrier protein